MYSIHVVLLVNLFCPRQYVGGEKGMANGSEQCYTYNLGRGNFLIKLRLLELQVVLGPLSRVSKD